MSDDNDDDVNDGDDNDNLYKLICFLLFGKMLNLMKALIVNHLDRVILMMMMKIIMMMMMMTMIFLTMIMVMIQFCTKSAGVLDKAILIKKSRTQNPHYKNSNLITISCRR